MSEHGSSFLTLAGHLELTRISGRLVRKKKQKHRYWFIFDEKACQLKYYANEIDLRTPQGSIDMSSGSISLSLQRGEERTVILSQGSVEYHLVAGSPSDARHWYRGLQDKKETSKQSKRHSLLLPPTPQPIPSVQQQRQAHSCDFPRSPNAANSRQPLGHGRKMSDPQTPPKKSAWLGDGSPKLARSLSLDTVLEENKSDSMLRKRPATITGEISQSEEGVDCLPPEVPPKVISPLADQPSPSNSMATPPELPPRDDSYVFVEFESHTNPDCHFNVMEFQMNGLRRDMELKDKLLEEQQELNQELRRIVDKLAGSDPDTKLLISEMQEVKLRVSHLESVNKTLNQQLLKKQKREEEEEHRVYTVEKQLLLTKSEHVKLLAKSLTIPTGSTLSMYMPGCESGITPEEDKARQAIARMINEDCPVEEACQLVTSNQQLLDFQDECGDMYFAENESLAFTYLIRRLYLRYTQEQQEQAKRKWADFLGSLKVSLRGGYEIGDKKKELKSNLLLGGLPLACDNMRVQLWNSLINRWIGDMRARMDESHNGSYYQCLVDKSEKEETVHERQIKLDLERTLPTNKLFRPESDAIFRMYNVLMAFVLHAPQTGYTQGMNQIVAMSLFFLDEEMAFWCLVAVVEKILPQEYFSHGLVGAQADQAVLLDVVSEKLPDLVAHLNKLDINITWVTLNWFITLYVDALPTEPAIRLWDFVLLEGRVALFRFAIGLLTMQKTQIMQIRDSVTLLQFLKSMTRHTFDVETMCKMAYDAKVSSNVLRRFEGHYHKIRKDFLQMELDKHRYEENAEDKKKQKQLKAIAAAEKLRERAPVPTLSAEEEEEDEEEDDVVGKPQSSLASSRHFTILPHFADAEGKKRKKLGKPRFLCSCPVNKNESWLVFKANNDRSLVAAVSINPAIKIVVVEIKVPKDPMCMCYSEPLSMVMVGTVGLQLLAFDVTSHKQLWTYSLQDSVLCITSWRTTTFVSLADGSIAVFEELTRSEPQPPKIVKLGSYAVQSLLVTSTGLLWCAVGTSVVILNAETLEQIDSASAGDEQQRNVVNHLSQSGHGVWVTYRGSTVITLFDIQTLQTLLHINYKQVVMVTDVPDTSDQTQYDLRITGFLVHGDVLWVGTGGGSVMLFKIEHSTVKNPLKLQRDFQRGGTSLRVKRKKTRSSLPGLLVGDGKEPTDGFETSVRSDNVTTCPSPIMPSKMRLTSTLSRGTMSSIDEQQSEYKLKFINGQSVAKTTDHVRKFIQFNTEECTHILSCVRATHEEANPVQLWDCRDIDLSKWSFRNVDYIACLANSEI